MTNAKNTVAKATLTEKTVISAYAELVKAEKTAKDKYVVFATTTVSFYNGVIAKDAKTTSDAKKALKGLLGKCGIKHPHDSEWLTVLLFLVEKVETAKKVELCLKANSFKTTLEVARRANNGGAWKLDKNGVLVKVEENATTTKGGKQATTKGGKQAPKAETTTTKGSEQPKEQVNRVTSDEVTKDLETLDELFTQLENVNLSFCSAETLAKFLKINDKIRNHIVDVARQKKYNLPKAGYQVA